VDIWDGLVTSMGRSAAKTRPTQTNRGNTESNKKDLVKQGLVWSGLDLAGFRQVIDLVEAAGIEFASFIVNVN
jgi:hypothetical protein